MTSSAPSTPKTALVLQHEEATPPGRVLDWLAAHQIQADVARVDLEDGHIDATGYDLVIPLGSEFAPYQDEISWIPREVAILREVHTSGRSVFGICFGGQLLARALGGQVHRAPRPEIGWFPVGTLDPGLVTDGPWFQWHFDSFDPPPDADVVARNDVGTQAFVIGRSMGLQFHPEVTSEIMEDWVKAYRHELDQERVDPEGLLEQTARVVEDSAARASKLFDQFLARISQGIR